MILAEILDGISAAQLGGYGLGALAQSRGMRTVAEGVETPLQQQRLAEAGCDAMQGFHLCRPLPADSMDAWLRARCGLTRS